MRIVTLDPFLTEVVCWLGLGEQLVGVSFYSDYPPEVSALPKVTLPVSQGAQAGMVSPLCSDLLDLKSICGLSPDLILARPTTQISQAALKAFSDVLKPRVGDGLRVCGYYPLDLNDIFEIYERIGTDLGKAEEGCRPSARFTAQLMDWSANFYERMRHKRVTLISGLQPLKLAGYWLPHLIQACSGVSQRELGGEPHREVSWREIVEFRPDVMLVAPAGADLQTSLASFKSLEKLPEWEEVLAVKRGQVFFCDGHPHFYCPGPRLLESVAILISAIAGLDSGYIAPRDSFFRLRWLEMQRHRF